MVRSESSDSTPASQRVVSDGRTVGSHQYKARYVRAVRTETKWRRGVQREGMGELVKAPLDSGS